MLKEGWDVRNVTVICGLRAYAAKSNILPEQTLGRGLRRMYPGNDTVRETVSVMGTPAFMAVSYPPLTLPTTLTLASPVFLPCHKHTKISMTHNSLTTQIPLNDLSID